MSQGAAAMEAPAPAVLHGGVRRTGAVAAQGGGASTVTARRSWGARPAWPAGPARRRRQWRGTRGAQACGERAATAFAREQGRLA